MLRMIRQFTFGNPKEILVPTLWTFASLAFSILPSIFVFMAIHILGAAFFPPYALDLKNLEKIAIVLLILVFIQFGVEYISYYYTYVRAYGNSSSKRNMYIKKLRELPLGFFSSKDSGELISSFSTDFANLEFVMCYWLPFPISTALLLLFSIVFLGAYHWQMAIAMFCIIPVSAILMLLSMKLSAKHSKNVLNAKANAATQLNEYLQGMKDLKAYNQTGSGFDHIKHAYKNLKEVSLKQETIPGSLSIFSSNFIQFMVPISAVSGMYFLLSGSLNPLDYIGLLIIATKLVSPTMVLMMSITFLRGMAVSAERLDAVMKAQSQSGTQPVLKMENYTFSHVDFSYTQDQPVLKDVSFSIQKEKLTALVGPSGSGKSTILRLMARFWDSTNGEIAVDGIDVKNITPESLLSNLSMVMQDTYLFRDTIRNNILFGREDATQQELEEACKRACCHDFISALPKGYNTMVGEGGATLSGGERQRISLARALIKKAPILLLDEPTASLDADNEAMVQQALDEATKNCTVIMIAHRLKTVRNAHQIIVLNQGQVDGIGTHDELMNTNTLYRKMWNLQSATDETIYKN